MSLPPGWTEFKTAEGRPYYHNSSRGETTWTHPVPPVPIQIEAKHPPPPLPSKKPVPAANQSKTTPSGAPDNNPARIDLMQAIRGGSGDLKKTQKKNAQSETTNNYSRGGGVTNDMNSSASRAPNSSSPVPAKRGGGGMLEELSNRFGSLKSVSAAEKTFPPKQSSTSPSQSPKVDNTVAGKTIAASRRFNSVDTAGAWTSQKSNSADRSDYERLDVIEKKLDKIMAHLGIS